MGWVAEPYRSSSSDSTPSKVQVVQVLVIKGANRRQEVLGKKVAKQRRLLGGERRSGESASRVEHHLRVRSTTRRRDRVEGARDPLSARARDGC